MRRNLLHNCIVHPFCGLVWLAADLLGFVGAGRWKWALVEFGERVHADPRWGP